MECPKCHRKIEENATVCPHCHKVLKLVCPNCHALSNSNVCSECGYIILEKCSKCGKTVSTDKENCKCGFPTAKSIAFQECECDEFASINIEFQNLKKIQKQLHSHDLFVKFNNKLRNLINSAIKGVDCKTIIYGKSYVLNMNRELSLQTSAHKAVRLGLKIINAFTGINEKILSEFGLPLNITLTVLKKSSEDLLKYMQYGNNIMLLNQEKQEKKHLRGMRLILNQDIRDIVDKEYRNDSAFTIERNGQTITFYEVILNEYILPPSRNQDDIPSDIKQKSITAIKNKKEKNEDIYSFKVFDISAKCKFIKTSTTGLLKHLDGGKIISIRSEQELEIKTSKLIDYYKEQDKKILRAVCTEENQYTGWGVFEQLLRDYYQVSANNLLLDTNASNKQFPVLYNFLLGKTLKASSSEDARFAYMENFGKWLSSLKDYVILIEGFEYIDDSTIQALSLYFDRFKKIVPDFVFITNNSVSVHSKIKGLLQVPIYKELTITPSSIDELFSEIKEDAQDFIESFYYEKIEENFGGSSLYLENALKFLTDKDILINFDNKLIIRNNMSVIVPTNLKDLLKARLKFIGAKYQSASLILAYSLYLGAKLDFKLLELLGVPDIAENTKIVENTGLGYVYNNVLYINNYNILKSALQSSLKPNTDEYLSKTILGTIGKGLDNTRTLILFGRLNYTKEEYLVLWKNSQFVMDAGDYDAYLKNCLGFLSLLDKLRDKVPEEDIENNKKEIFQNILMSLYSYSPEKIYSIENVLLLDAFKENNDEKIVKLSNLMLQGALISSNYTDAVSLMHNILTRMDSPTLIVNEKINTKFLLLSLVNIEILFNIGDFYRAIEIADDLLKVISRDNIAEITPAGFSTNFFVTHLMETFRIVAFAKIIVLDNDLDEFFGKVRNSLQEDLPDKECIVALKDFLAGKPFVPSNTENSTPFSKAVFLLLQQFADERNDYKNFAQNCYQAKLLASDINQSQIERFCDILIAHSYANIGIKQKAEAIYKDVISKSEKSAIFIPLVLAKYYMAKLKISNNEFDEGLLLINDSLALIQKDNNQAKVFYAVIEKFFIKAAEDNNLESINISSEIQKLALVAPDGELNRITGDIQIQQTDTPHNDDASVEIIEK